MSEWKRVRVADVATSKGLVGGPFGSSLGSKDYVEFGVPVIRGINLGSQRKFDGQEFVYVTHEKADEELARNLATPGDIVLTQRGTLGQVGIVPPVPFDKYVISQSQMRLRVDPTVALSEFIYYQFRSPNIVAMIHNRAITTGVPHINLGILGSLEIVLPPISEQRAIAALLGALDDKIAINERICDTSIQMARAHFEAAGATVSVPLKDVAAIFDGPHATPTKTEDGPWFLSISSLKDGLLDLGESAHLSEEDFPRWTKRVQPQAGDVLFSYETRLGDAALMLPGIRASLGRRMALLRPKDMQVSGTLLLHAYLSQEFQDEIKKRTIHGATVDRIPIKELSRWPIPLPPRESFAQLSAALSVLHDCASQLVHENRTLVSLRDTLLPELMSGRLRVRDAERIVEDSL